MITTATMTQVTNKALEDGASRFREILDRHGINGYRDVSWFGHNQRINVYMPGNLKLSVINGTGKDNSDWSLNSTGVLITFSGENTFLMLKRSSFEEALESGYTLVPKLLANGGTLASELLARIS